MIFRLLNGNSRNHSIYPRNVVASVPGERVRVDSEIWAEPHVVSALEHEMTGGKRWRPLAGKRTAEIKVCLLQRPAVWCLAVEGPCAG
jgi:hypothetical protein